MLSVPRTAGLIASINEFMSKASMNGGFNTHSLLDLLLGNWLEKQHVQSRQPL